MMRALCFGVVLMAAVLGGQASAATAVAGRGPALACYQNAERGRADYRALQDCEDALDDSLSVQDRAATLVNRGILLSLRHTYSRAIADFDAALGLNPTLAEAYVNRGVALIRLNDFQAARTALDRGLELNPEDPAKAYYGRAIANEELGDLRAAYEDYNRAAALAPGWSDPRVELTRFRVNR